MPLAPGSRVDAYELVRPLGSGGMGEVWLATEAHLRRQVALKLLPTDLTRDPGRIARFQQEARAASALNHPNVCTILALGETEDGHHYIAMEYVEGEPLRKRLMAGPLPLGQALEVAVQIASALVAAHSAGIVHRDIKPENVVLRPDGFAKVVDFGLAKLTGALDASALDSTQTAFRTEVGAVVGTVAYMSPEQARGDPVDARTDVWALGAVLYEMVAGRSPFASRTTSDTLAAILTHEPPSITNIAPTPPSELQRILHKALQKERQQRYQTMQDFALDLQVLRDDLQTQARAADSNAELPPRQTGQATREASLSRGRRIVAGAAALAVVIAAAVGLSWWGTRRMPRPHATADAPPHRNLTRLTFGPGLQTDPTFSPDGRFVAYASDRNGNFDIWVQPVNGGSEPIQVTNSPAHDTSPAWSPDGSTLVFQSERNGSGLFLVPFLGGAEQRLTSFGESASWSNDGSEILFRDGFLPLSRDTGVPTRLYAVPVTGGNPRELIAEFLRNGSWRWISGHPDGRISVLGDYRAIQPGFFTVTRDGKQVIESKQVPLGPNPSALPHRFQWNQAGTALFIEATANAVRSIWRVRVHPETLEWLSAEQLTSASGDVATTVSRDGTKAAFSRQQESLRVWAFPLQLSPRPRLTGAGHPVTEDDAVVEAPALSPDGRKLAYHLRRPGINRTELWVADLDGSRRELLAIDARGACWSRDSTRVAYDYLRLDTQPIQTVTAYRELGGTEHFVSRWTSKFLFAPSDWTLDDSALLGSYSVPPVSEAASLALWSISRTNADRPDRVVLSLRGAGVWQGKFSPNGRWISFVTSHQPLRLEMWVAPAEGAPPERWTRIASDHRWPDKPRWDPQGKSLFFISRKPSSYFNLWAVAFDPKRGEPIGTPFVLTNFDSPGLVVSPYIDANELSISARHAVLPMLSRRGNIWMVDNVDE